MFAWLLKVQVCDVAILVMLFVEALVGCLHQAHAFNLHHKSVIEALVATLHHNACFQPHITLGCNVC